MRRTWMIAAAIAAGIGCGNGGGDGRGGESRSGAAGGSGGNAASTPAAASMRIVSLTPSATEVVAALGAAELLVGVDEYSKYPAEVAKLPKVGSFLSPNLEAITRLRPTLVVVDDIHDDAGAALRAAGIETVMVPIHGLSDVETALRTAGKRLGRTAEAEAQIATIDAAVAAARERHPARRPRVLAVIDREAGGLGNLVAAGPGSWLDELLAVLGAANVLAASGVRYPKISVEEVLATQPDVILDASYAADPASPRADWATLRVPAVDHGRVIVAKEPFLVAPSPRVAEALTVLAAAIQP